MSKSVPAANWQDITASGHPLTSSDMIITEVWNKRSFLLKVIFPPELVNYIRDLKIRTRQNTSVKIVKDIFKSGTYVSFCLYLSIVNAF